VCNEVKASEVIGPEVNGDLTNARKGLISVKGDIVLMSVPDILAIELYQKIIANLSHHPASVSAR